MCMFLPHGVIRQLKVINEVLLHENTVATTASVCPNDPLFTRVNPVGKQACNVFNVSVILY